MSKRPYTSLLKWSIWILAVTFYLYEYLLRVFPSAATHAIMETFGLQATSFGLMVAFYLYGYAPMQLVSGLLMDRFGARIWLTLSTLLCASGAFIFGIADTFFLGAFARLLMGTGSACAFVGVIYLSSHWFSPRFLPLLIAIGNSLGMLGAAFGEGPISFLSGKYGVDEINMIFGVFGVVLATAIFFVVRNDPHKKHKNVPPLERSPMLASLKMACANKSLWINAFSALFFYAPTIAFGALWAAPFIAVAYNTSAHLGALASSMFYFGWIVGGPIFGKFAMHSKDRARDVALAPLGAFVALIALIYFPIQYLPWAFIWLFIAGGFCSAELLHYTISVELSSPSIKGTASAITNFLVFIGGAILQPLIGIILDLFWTGEMEGSLRAYSLESYQIALSIFPLALIIASLISWFKLKPRLNI